MSNLPAPGFPAAGVLNKSSHRASKSSTSRDTSTSASAKRRAASRCQVGAAAGPATLLRDSYFAGVDWIDGFLRGGVSRIGDEEEAATLGKDVVLSSASEGTKVLGDGVVWV